MAIATGTAAVIGAGLAAGGALGGAAMSARSSSQASKIQQQANERAFALAEKQEAQRRKEYEDRLAMERAQWEAREERRAQILARFGRRYNLQPYAPRPFPGAPAAASATARNTTLGGLVSSPFGPQASNLRRTTLGGMYGA